jgi:hypothetical protein
MTFKIGIVTVTYNSELVLDDFLRSLSAQINVNWTLYAVDNASSDNTLLKLENFARHNAHLSIQIIPNLDNKGVAAGNNQGIQAALADNCTHVLLLNNDTVFDSMLLSELVRGTGEFDADIVVPKMLYYDQPNIIWCAGGYFTWKNCYSGSIYGMGEPDAPIYDAPRQIEYDATCCMLIAVEVFQRIGLMDELYFVYYDDTDFCFRARKAEIRMYYLPNVRLLHKVSSLTKGDDSPFTTHYMVRNRVYYMRKNVGGLFALVGLLSMQVRYCINAVRSRSSLAKFRLQQHAFREGLAMPIGG